MRTDSPGAEISEINMTPFVDIVLVLLVIFMATATLIAENKLNIEVPKASASTNKPEEKEIGTVFITKDGKTYIQDKEVSAEQIESEIRAGEYKAVIIKSDGAAQFQSVVAALDGCKKAGIVKYSIDTAQAQ